MYLQVNIVIRQPHVFRILCLHLLFWISLHASQSKHLSFRLASSLGIGDYLYLGQGEEKGGGRSRLRNLACALEALIAAIFIDQGFASARDFILKLLGSDLQQIAEEGPADYKSALQELVQARNQGRPLYQLVKTEGPDHDRRFTVEVVIVGEVLGRGSAKSKQLAEKEAAREALNRLSG
ncbi:ribonuclease III family protein [Chloroflexota bacterium]